jgi:hypothetical protein
VEKRGAVFVEAEIAKSCEIEAGSQRFADSEDRKMEDRKIFAPL